MIDYLCQPSLLVDNFGCFHETGGDGVTTSLKFEINLIKSEWTTHYPTRLDFVLDFVSRPLEMIKIHLEDH
jgi:hypothetical protein